MIAFLTWKHITLQLGKFELLTVESSIKLSIFPCTWTDTLRTIMLIKDIFSCYADEEAKSVSKSIMCAMFNVSNTATIEVEDVLI